MRGTMDVHVLYNSWYIFCRHLQNKKVRCLEKVNHDDMANFPIFISNLSLCPRFSCIVVLTVISN